MIKQTKIWTTKEGHKIRICDMSEVHLSNAIAWIEKKGQADFDASLASILSYSAGFSDDSMALLAAENQIEDMEEEGFDPWNIPLYTELYNEKQR